MTAGRSFPALLDELRGIAGIRALTALRYRGDRAERAFSSHPEIFAAEGVKLFAEAPTMARVRAAGTPVVTEGAAAIRAGFPDGDAILGLGADAIANLPVRAGDGRAVGQLNLMGRAGGFGPEAMGALQAVADRYAVCFAAEGEEAACD
ncbi:hypothetical protein [Poseidonocella sp. HB161398]|uniref:hypothetical protein n=1 Tax=Poseidonocella sp. HB161398 TaxID=2320855 RepID=UPI0011099461|nr:hypothetical protein [Poseidonocella sp. HB161398]